MEYKAFGSHIIGQRRQKRVELWLERSHWNEPVDPPLARYTEVRDDGFKTERILLVDRTDIEAQQQPPSLNSIALRYKAPGKHAVVLLAVRLRKQGGGHDSSRPCHSLIADWLT